ncbi:defective in Cullin neddylation protein 1 [Abortiporus biennis]|nr:defective in Cullin neddylation protein 1 [Abortiporus biennis]
MSKKVDKMMEEKIAQFVGVTGATVKDARRYLDKYKKVEIAVDAFYNEPVQPRQSSIPSASTSKLNDLFNKYKDSDGDDITISGTMQFCQDLSVDPEDVVLLAVAMELKSPRMCEWTRKGWVDGWKGLGVDTIPSMKGALLRLRDKLGSDPEYFQKVYNYTFEFARLPGQRSLPSDMALGFWAILLPHGLQGGALAHINPRSDDDDAMIGVEEEGWREEYSDWWSEFITERNIKGVSKDTWQMFLEFVRTIDAKFEKYDPTAAWPSTIDEFVEYAKARLA